MIYGLISEETDSMAANGENQRERMRERPRKGGKPMSKSFVNKALLGGAVAAGAAVWAIAPRTFSDKRRNYVPSIPDVWYAHRGLHDAGSGLTAQYANESGAGTSHGHEGRLWQPQRDRCDRSGELACGIRSGLRSRLWHRA